MKGNDVLFGEGQDDDIIGGYGNDWISGGTGDDGVLGDDGRISTSRNSTSARRGATRRARGSSCRNAPHVLQRAAQRRRRAAGDRPRLADSNGNVINEFIYTPGHVQEATINVAGALNKSVNLTPFNVDPLGDTRHAALRRATATTTSSSAAWATTSCTAARATTRSPAPRRCRPRTSSSTAHDCGQEQTTTA